MGNTLIVTKSYDDKFAETGAKINLDDWLRLAEHDPALRMRTEPFEVVNPRTKETISVDPLPGQTELLVGGDYVPFLGYRFGDLVMRFGEDLEDERNPVRRKVAEVARRLGAVITDNEGDEILRW